jgi:hypothetical protein
MTATRSIPDGERAAREQWIVTILLIVLTGAFATFRFLRAPTYTSDLDQLWHAANALRSGRNPYEAVGPGRPFEWGFPLFYPLPAILLVLPFTFLPIAAARLAFSLVSAAALGYAIGPRWRMLWPLVPSVSYFLAISRNQWSPLVLAAVWLPALGFVVAAKPNVGALALVAQNRRNAVLVLALATALGIIAFLVRPSWLAEWLAIVRSLPNQKIALVQPGGVLLLGALLIWRSIDGRVILAAGLLPQTPSLYDVLPLFMLCRTTRQAILLSALTHATQWSVIARGPYGTPSDYYNSIQRWTVWLILLPCLVLALSNRRLGAAPLDHAALGAAAPTSRRWTFWADGLLVGGIVISLALQLWMAFRTS